MGDRPTTLVVAAHPDDIDFGCAGTVARWVDDGVDVRYCVVTDGEAGGSDTAVSRTEMAEIRRAEQRAAAAVVGVTECVFLGHPDGRLQAGFELRRDITRVIRTVRPDRVLCHSPDRMYDIVAASHPDHLAAGEAALCAVYPDARNPFAHPELAAEGLAPHVVREVWMMGAPGATSSVDVTEVADRKLAALGCHRSQLADADATFAAVRAWMAATAEEAGLPEGRLAEVFRVIDTV